MYCMPDRASLQALKCICYGSIVCFGVQCGSDDIFKDQQIGYCTICRKYYKNISSKIYIKIYYKYYKSKVYRSDT